MELNDLKVAVLAEKDFEDMELLYPLIRLREAGAKPVVIGPGESSYRGKHGLVVPTDARFGEVDPSTLDGVIVPGGWSPDWLRRDQRVLDLVATVFHRGKLVASICHGPWVLISANVVCGRTLTAVVALKDDLTNAGATYVDRDVVVDGNLVTSRTPRDIPAWSRAIISALSGQSPGA